MKSLTAGDLVFGVLEKHRRFLERYRKEFEELDSRLNLIEGEVKNAKDSRTQMLERKEVLREKRQQFYHQAEGVLEKELLPKMDPMPADKLREDLKKLKGQAQPSEEQKLARELKENLREFAQGAGLEESVLLQVEAKIDEAVNPNQEIKKLEEEEEQMEEGECTKTQEITRGRPRHKLLNNKIKSHEEALRYWEKVEL